MLWRSLGPEIAVPWYLLPWLVFALPYQSFFLRREWFHVTLCLATMGFNSSVLLLAPRSRNIWSWFGRLLAFMTECTTCLELCISMCSHAIMKESWNGMAPRWNSSKQFPCPSKDKYYVLFYAATQFHAHLELPWTLDFHLLPLIARKAILVKVLIPGVLLQPTLILLLPIPLSFHGTVMSCSCKRQDVVKTLCQLHMLPQLPQDGRWFMGFQRQS